MKAAARVIYRGSWETERPAIMKKYGWDKSNSEVLIRCVLLIHLTLPYSLLFVFRRPQEIGVCVRSTPRRFGKTFSCARCPPPHSLTLKLTIRLRLAASPSSVRASRSPLASRSLFLVSAAY